MQEDRGDGAQQLSAEREEVDALGGAAAIELGTGVPRLIKLGFWTVVFIFVALAFAFVTVLLATYEPDKTFGELKDSSRSSRPHWRPGAAGTVAALLAPWGDSTADAEA